MTTTSAVRSIKMSLPLTKNAPKSLSKSPSQTEGGCAVPQTTPSSSKIGATSRRKFLEGVKPSFSRKICPVCGKAKNPDSKVCRGCFENIRRSEVELTCASCEKTFKRLRYEVEKSGRRGHKDHYCSKSCSEAHHGVKNAKSCATCSKPMPGARNTKYCSPECRSKARPSKPTVCCPVCSKQFTPRYAKHAHCSKVCSDTAHGLGMLGKSNPNFKDGSSYRITYFKVREHILKRDKNCCVVCGSKADLRVHHIDEVKTNDLPENLVTLCNTCHITHTSRQRLRGHGWAATLRAGQRL